MTLPVPQAPPLAHFRGVELMKAGQWDAMSGRHTFTREDLVAAVAALECPSVRRPVLKLGHDGNHGVGEPAVGWIDNMATTDDGTTLIADYVGMPGWFGDVLGSAYPDRSIEGTYDLRCQIGHVHPFVVEAVALLGIEAPAIGTLNSLAGVAQLYGVELSQNTQDGERVVLTIRNQEASTMPNPNPAQVAAGVNTEDVRRAYYEEAPWEMWITEFDLDPLQLIVINDFTGELVRIPVTVAGDGADGVTFGEAVAVVVRYEDVAPGAGETPAVAAGRATQRHAVLSYASRAESRPDAPRTPAAAAADGGQSPNVEGSAAVEFTTEQIAALLAALGLASDTTDAQAVVDAVVALADDEANEPPDASTATASAAARLPDGVVAIDREQLEDLRTSAAQGVAARAQQEDDHRASLVAAAVADGRIAPAGREGWLAALKAGHGAAETLAGLEPGLVPVGKEIGHSGGDAPELTTASVRESSAYKNWSM